jgi:hypothetical protein
MDAHVNRWPIVEAGTPQVAVVEAESDSPDEVERGGRCGAQPGDVSDIGGYFRLPQCDV